ncbi:hypothetical protein [Microbacterium sp. zg-YB36]|uniref:hypothetical protein n=1 Tax=Microbacterium sp. zg-YB36 TaxID=2969407 RepID=UPI00214B4908|nr:hypothetical protein [Microbacterium sp. zg-YB36]MDL5351154.1 hypothetical protein [Microbacterium sp. zg-YB36]
MTAYASKTPRMLNSDPEPWLGRSPVTNDLIRTPVAPAGLSGFHRQPRDYYNHEQHNEPNPILTEFREVHARPHLSAHPASWLAGHWIMNWTSHERYADESVTEQQLDHARKVLERLARA